MSSFDLIISGGFVVDPVNQREGYFDIGIKDGLIIEVSSQLDPTLADEITDARGYCVMPGIIDLHTHMSSWLGGRYSHKMLALAGVTTALDMSGPVDSVLAMARDYGAGLTVASLNAVWPGHTVKSDNPDSDELCSLLEASLRQGAIGLKLLGGHYPLTPEATARTITVANQQHAYIAFHAGTSQTGSTIEGCLEAIQLAAEQALHLAHVNSYCRGAIRPAMTETEEAIRALESNPRIISEAYISPFNGTSAKCSGGEPESLVTKRCLATGGFSATEQGMEDAILAGWGHINLPAGGAMTLAAGKAGRDYWRKQHTNAAVSFPVNPAGPRLLLAAAKRKTGGFIVDAISTDGGGIPRNVIVELGLSLVKLQALTLAEFATKTSSNPARILGLDNKGHFTPGADADITILDLERQKPRTAIAGGKVIMHAGYVCGQASKIITTASGTDAIRAQGLTPVIVDLAKSGFYQGRQ
jgi:dihydroorotase-like cyclic amidohydrolase